MPFSRLLRHPGTLAKSPIRRVPPAFIRSFTFSHAMSDSSIDPTSLAAWKAEIKADAHLGLAASALRTHNASEVLINREKMIEHSVNVFNHTIKTEGAPVTNQKSSGRCWLFAATNVMRVGIMERRNLKELQLSPSFLFFYDKLEKANFFLEQIIDTGKEDVGSRIVQHLLTDPICDGGQFDMFVNIVEKYGIVPNTVFPDSYNTTASYRMNFMIKTKLREFAMNLRDSLAEGRSSEEISALKNAQIQEIHKLLVLFLGSPPGPSDEFTWEYVDKDGNYHSERHTPIGFYRDVAQFKAEEAVSLLNDPRNEYERIVKVDRLGNVHGAKTVHYLNVDSATLADVAIERIKQNKPVFFGSHTPIYMDKKLGIMDPKLWNFDLIPYEAKQGKAERLAYHQSLMTHAMVITAVHLNEEGRPVRWRVENSWGKDSGLNGYYVMSQEYFEEYVYQIVADRDEMAAFSGGKYLSLVDDLLNCEEMADDKKIVLPPWDPCGALAN